MKKMYKVTVKVDTEDIDLYFDDQHRAERFIKMLTKGMTPKGKKHVRINNEVVMLIDSDEDVLNAFNLLEGN